MPYDTQPTDKPAIVVEKGIPRPAKQRGGRHLKFPFAVMDVGDSFVVPRRSDATWKNYQNSAHYAVSYQKRNFAKTGDGKKFEALTVVEDGQKIMRIWRIV